ncbi:GTP 3',8-cyclase MoaA [Nannocystaceae bacterium ST9]
MTMFHAARSLMTLVELRRRPALERVPASGPVLVDRLARRVRYLRVSLTDRCNLRCTYCMPEDGIDHVARSEVLTLEEVVRMAAAFVAWGVDRIRLTGGEPTLRRNLPWLVASLAGLRTPEGRPLEVVMTTNGERLHELAGPLREAGLHALTVSLDSLDPDRYVQITRRGRLDRCLAGIAAAHAAGFTRLKLNTVAVQGFNDDELADLCRYAWSFDATPRFIELMPMSAGRLFVPGTLLPAAEIRARIAAAVGGALVDDQAEGVRGHGPARYFRVEGGPHAGRRIGTIAAMTENFCASCNRLRVSATGQLHACLARDDTGDLRAALRTSTADADDRLEQVVRAALGVKRDAHGFELDGRGGPDKAMISIGG